MVQVSMPKVLNADVEKRRLEDLRARFGPVKKPDDILSGVSPVSFRSCPTIMQ
jgi:hypothetical protein